MSCDGSKIHWESGGSEKKDCVVIESMCFKKHAVSSAIYLCVVLVVFEIFGCAE